MVGNTAPRHTTDIEKPEKDYTFLPDKPKSTSVSLNDIIHNKMRFEASAFDLEAKAAINLVKNCKYGYVYLWSEKGLIDNAFSRPRFKRLFLNKSEYPIYQPSLITEIYPKPQQYISFKTDTDISMLRVKRGMVLLTISGTIGKSSYVSSTLDNKIFSHDLLRIIGKNQYDSGYIYVFFNTGTGQKILQSNNYGAVVEHIEPEHLQNVVIPNAPENIKKTIHELIEKSYELRDESNELMDEAERILYEELSLPPIEDLKVSYFKNKDNIRNFQVRLSKLNMRFDGSYHLPIVEKVMNTISMKCKKQVTVSELSSKIILAGVFKRTYVDAKHGVPFLGGREMMQLSPDVDKFLSRQIHNERIKKELAVQENYILISDRGTIGKVQIVPRHWANFAVSQNIIKIVPKSDRVAGYLYAFLNSDYGKILINRNTYGAVVDMIDNNSVSNITIPLISEEGIDSVSEKVLLANTLRYDAFLKEQEAIRIMNEDVIGSQKD